MSSKINITYDISTAAVGDGSATGYIASRSNWFRDFKLKDVILEICNISTISNLQQLKAFIDDLIYLENQGTTVIFSNTYGE